MMGHDSYENTSCGVEQVLRTHGHLGGNIYHATWRKPRRWWELREATDDVYVNYIASLLTLDATSPEQFGSATSHILSRLIDIDLEGLLTDMLKIGGSRI
jgi:hypothetical protein